MTSKYYDKEYPQEFLELIEALKVPEISACVAYGRERIGMLRQLLIVDKDDWVALAREFSDGLASQDQGIRNDACSAFTSKREFLEKKVRAFRQCESMMDPRFNSPRSLRHEPRFG